MPPRRSAKPTRVQLLADSLEYGEKLCATLEQINDEGARPATKAALVRAKKAADTAIAQLEIMLRNDTPQLPS